MNSVFVCYMERLPGCGWCSGNKVCPCCPVRVVCGGRVTVVIAWGKRPVPFRTRKLRLTAPMVLQPGGCGRVGHRRTHFEGEGPNEYASLLDQVVQAERECLVGAFTHLTHQPRALRLGSSFPVSWSKASSCGRP